MNNSIRSALVAVGVLLAIGIQAHGQTPSSGAATSVTAACKDGTTFTGSARSGACSGHGGVKTWGTSTAATSATPAVSASIVPAPTTVATAKLGGGAGQVWVNTDSKVYHCVGSRWYGKTKQGEYMSEQAAKASGFHPSQSKMCS